jgi:glycine/D-amino acid oxidase-like deaminating enzyme
MSSYDAVIIGGGVIGSCIAYYLSKEDLHLALIEKGDIASGTSSACDGNVLIADKKPGYDTRLAFISQQLLSNLREEIAYDFDYSQRGSIYIIESSEEWQVAEQYVKEQKRDGYPLRMMDKYEVHEDEPYLADDIIGGVEIACDASLNPMTFAFGLLNQSRENGLDIYDHTLVKDIELDTKGRINKVVTDKRDFDTDIVINAAGVWAPEIGKMIGLEIPIKPRQGQLLVSEKTFKVGKRKIVEFGYMMAKFGDADYKRNVSPDIEKNGIAFVFEPTLADNFLIGSSRAFVGYNTDVSIEVMQGLARRATRFFPVMKDINVIRAYAGLRPYVADHFPIVSGVESIPGFYIAAGHEGDGIGLGPVTGKIISQMILGEDLIIPVDRLSFSRFLN